MKWFVSTFFLLLSTHLLAQNAVLPDSNAYVPQLVLGTSLTYIWGDQEDPLQEYSWALNAAVSPWKHWYLGLNYINIWSGVDTLHYPKYSLGGVFGQFQFGSSKRLQVFPEVGIYRGNYCTCNPDTGDHGSPYRVRGLTYWAAGGGIDIFLYKGLQLDLSFMAYTPFNYNSEKTYSYTQYIIGLNYVFRLRKHERPVKGIPQPSLN